MCPIAADTDARRRAPQPSPISCGPATRVSTSYSTGGVVIEVKEYFYTAPTGETLSHFTIVYVPPDRAAKYRDSDHHWINECVAVGDRILMLFEANRDEVFVVDLRPPDTQPSRTILNT
ncbi:hypothetical protein ACVDG8_038115 (plasmid) [Mesorhizobium sp. ORM8.1]